MKKYLSCVFAACLLLAALSTSARAYEYDFSAPDAGLFAEPTSDSTIYVSTSDTTNIDRSKTAAVIPPTFGSPTSYTLNAGELLTPNLVNRTNASSGTASVSTSAGVTAMTPTSIATPDNTFTVSTSGSTSGTGTKYTDVTSDLYYSGGYLGTLKIPAIDLTVKVYQGTDTTSLAKGAGHFDSTSIWDGNIAIAAHNRGVNNHFGKIHNLTSGDTITFTTRLGTRIYEVYSVSKISNDDVSILDSTSENIITLVTCVMDQPQYRWCVRAKMA
jgi:sortase A